MDTQSVEGPGVPTGTRPREGVSTTVPLPRGIQLSIGCPAVQP